MRRSFFSSSWYRVADLKPRLRGHIEVHRQLFRGSRWYVLQNHASGQFHRFSWAAHMVVGQMDGRRTIREIWENACNRLGDELPTQDEVIQLLAQLHAADLIQCEVPPDILEVTQRSERLRRNSLMQQFKSPLSLRLPLVDPDRFLDGTIRLIRPLCGPVALIAWLALMVAALLQAAPYWTELTNELSDRVWTVENVLAGALIYLVLKALHELGHAYAVKASGGEVHEMGLMLIVFMPMPYVDASAAAAFRSKWKRAGVAAAGVIVETAIAAIALFLWLRMEPGASRAVAFNVMLIAGISTVLFNGNPLLRYDGYFVLADLLEMPNLATRANSYIFYLLKRYLFWVEGLRSTARSVGERRVFVIYGLAAFGCRLFIISAIALMVAGQYFFIGVAIAIWSAAGMLLVPTGKGIWYLIKSAELRRRRGRALVATGTLLACALGGLFGAPLPYGTVTSGVVWVPDGSLVRAWAEGFIVDVVASSNSEVKTGDVLIRLGDPLIAAELRVADAEVRQFEAKLAYVDVADPAEANVVREQLLFARGKRDRLQERTDQLIVRSQRDGRFVLPMETDRLGRFVKKSDTLGYVVDPTISLIQVTVPQADIDLIRIRTHSAEVRVVGDLSPILPARIERVVPAASNSVLSKALTSEGGGELALDPRDPNRSLQSTFNLILVIPSSLSNGWIGQRVFVRFDHGEEALAWRMYRRLRQLFLREFNV